MELTVERAMQSLCEPFVTLGKVSARALQLI